MTGAGGLLLALDAGNTDIKAAVFDGPRPVARLRAPRRGGADPLETLRAGLAALPAGVHWRGAVLTSVAPSLDGALERLCRSITGHAPLVIGAASDLGITVATETPEQVGADRLVNAAAAFLLFGGPLVVADLGTAITVCAVDAGGRFLGGAIAPGPAMARDALAERTEKLPVVALQAPPGPIGRTTEHAMQAGLVWGFAGLLDRLIDQALAALGHPAVAGVYLTGGLAALFAPHLAHGHRLVPDLTLDGLRLLFERARRP
ncbi:MAG: type III pantothenate kinase [Nitrospirae bacterium]|nr:type III pantothenate kinase [Nitrospirota bacterium]